jgi:hypothetical protein
MRLDLYRKYQRFTLLILFLILAGSGVGIVVPAGSGWDFGNFYDTGRRVIAGQIQDIYHAERLIGGEPPHGKMRFWGTPISAWLYAPLGYLSPTWALIVFKIQNTLAYFVALLLLYFHNRKFVGGLFPLDKTQDKLAQAKFAALFAFLSLIYQPFWTVYRVGGQTTPSLFLLFTLALLSHTGGQLFLSALCLILACLIKPSFITALIFLTCISGLRFFGYVVAIFSFIGLVSLSTMGWNLHKEFLILMGEGTRKLSPWFYNSSLSVTLDNFKIFLGPESLSPFRSVVFTLGLWGIKAIVIGTFIYLIFQSRSQKWFPATRRHFDFLMAVSFSLLISQVVFEHYLAPLFLLLIYVVVSHRSFSYRALILIGAIFLLAIGQNLILIDFLRNHFKLDSPPELLLMGLFKSGPLLLTLIFLWRHYRELFQSYVTQEWANYTKGEVVQKETVIKYENTGFRKPGQSK